MPMQPPAFGAPSRPRKPWQRAEGTPDTRLRGRAGVKERQRILREEPLCRACLGEGRTTATAEIDHIKPLSEGGTDARSNKQGLCREHHEAKSAAERAAARAG